MIPHFCKSVALFCLKNSQPLSKPHICCSLAIPILFFSSTSVHKPVGISVFDYLTKHHQFSPEAALKISKSISHVKSLEASDSVLFYLKETGFSQTHIENVVKGYPRVLFADLDINLKPKFKLFKEVGLSSDDIPEIVSRDPWILSRSADNRLGPSILKLREVMGSIADVTRILKLSAWFLKYDLEKTMLPSIEYMTSCGISLSQIIKYVFHFPRFFLYKPETMRYLVSRTDEMGIDRKSKMFLPAMRVLSSMTEEKWKQKLQLFRNLGLSDDDILDVFRRVPQVFAVSERKIEDASKILLGVRNYDISFIVSHPELLVCSVKHRLKPRLKVLEILESKNMFKKKPSLTTVCKLTDKRFFEKYVHPYSAELEGKYMVKEVP